MTKKRKRRRRQQKLQQREIHQENQNQDLLLQREKRYLKSTRAQVKEISLQLSFLSIVEDEEDDQSEVEDSQDEEDLELNDDSTDDENPAPKRGTPGKSPKRRSKRYTSRVSYKDVSSSDEGLEGKLIFTYFYTVCYFKLKCAKIVFLVIETFVFVFSVILIFISIFLIIIIFILDLLTIL